MGKASRIYIQPLFSLPLGSHGPKGCAPSPEIAMQLSCQNVAAYVSANLLKVVRLSLDLVERGQAKEVCV